MCDDSDGGQTLNMLSMPASVIMLHPCWYRPCHAMVPACCRSHDSVRKFSICQFCLSAKGNSCKENIFYGYFSLLFCQPAFWSFFRWGWVSMEIPSCCPSSNFWSPRLARSLLFFVVDSVCLSVCHGKTSVWFLLWFSMESSYFLAISSPWPPLQNVVLRFLI